MSEANTAIATPPTSGFTQTEKFALTQRRATAMMRGVFIPDHLRSKAGNDSETVATLVSIIQMAEVWGMTPEQVAQATYPVKGKIGYEGKLYAALANAHGNLKGGLRIIFSGNGPGTSAVVFGSDRDLTKDDHKLLIKFSKTGDSDAATELELVGVRCVRLSVEECDTGQAMWKKDPQQKLFYTGATKWCRRYVPDLVMGVVSVEDLERMDWEDRNARPSIASVTAAITAGNAEKTIDVPTMPVAGQSDTTTSEANQDAEPDPEVAETPEQIEAGKAIAFLNTEIARCKKKGELEALLEELQSSPDWEAIRRLNLVTEAEAEVRRAIARLKAH
jgi:hypothetical protein